MYVEELTLAIFQCHIVLRASYTSSSVLLLPSFHSLRFDPTQLPLSINTEIPPNQSLSSSRYCYCHHLSFQSRRCPPSRSLLQVWVQQWTHWLPSRPGRLRRCHLSLPRSRAMVHQRHVSSIQQCYSRHWLCSMPRLHHFTSLHWTNQPTYHYWCSIHWPFNHHHQGNCSALRTMHCSQQLCRFAQWSGMCEIDWNHCCKVLPMG